MLGERLPFGWLRERDIDLLLCAELHARGGVAALLASAVGAGGARLGGAWVSHAEVDGESDLVVEFLQGDERVVALVENKIAAAFQPGQGARYRARAGRLAASGARAVTVLLAPEAYFSRPGSAEFDVHLGYEALALAARQAGDPRSAFFADALEGGVLSYRRGYVAEPDQAVSDTWLACWEVASEVAPDLNFRRPGDKPGRSTWFYFREAGGMPAGGGAVLVLKAERGQADLQFSGVPAGRLEVAAPLRDADMQVVPANKSASIRILVPAVDFTTGGVAGREALAEGLRACERLRAYFVEHGSGILGRLQG